MKNWIKSIFSSHEESQAVRQLTHPRDLQLGDIIKFRYLSQPDLSNQQFEVKQINTYDFEDRNLTEFVLRGVAAEPIYLTVNEYEDEPFLSISRKINKDMVAQLFDLDEFALLFDDESHNILHRQTEPPELAGWTAETYQQEIFAERGYFYKQDFRGRSVPESTEDAEDFDYYLAIDATRQYVIEAEVYDGGETDVLVTIRRPLEDIEEMWPGSNG